VFLVDAYNLAYSTGKAVSFADAYRMALEISNVLLRKSYRVIFVFDGRTDTPHPSYVKFAGERRPGMTADEWIIEYVKRHRGDTIKLVTRDRSLADRARHAHPNLYVLDPKDFLRFVDRLSASDKTYSGKKPVDTYDIQTSMMDEMEDFLLSLRRRKRRRGR
jgi:hypothetical protein